MQTAKSEFMPNISLSGFAGFQSIGLNKLMQPSSRIIGWGPAIHLPILEGGTLRANLSGKNAAYDNAVASYNQTLTEALRELADQVAGIENTEKQIEQQNVVALQAARQGCELAQTRYKAGLGSQLQVLGAESAYLTQSRVSANLLARRIDLQIGLIKALGGGVDATAPATVSQQTNTQG